MNTMTNNICLKTDSYKLNHWNQYPHGTQTVYSYYESRKGAKFDDTVFFGLQFILKKFLVGTVVTRENIEKAALLCKAHFGNDTYFNREGWEHILNNCGGKLPVRIKAVPEGMVIPINNVLMTVENTDEKCFWLTNFLETLLCQVWYPCTVATLSRNIKKMEKSYLEKTSDGGLLNFMLHDFGYRGVSSDDSAGIGGAAHLVNFLGTDTVVAMEYAMAFYNASLDGLAYSVAATEHSIMTARGQNGEEEVLTQLLNEYPTGILSVVSDSYDIYNFVDKLVGQTFKDRILKRDGIFVVRPDSVTPQHPTPEAEMVWLAENLYKNFGGVINSKGYKVINPKVRLLWGDGIDYEGIELILRKLDEAGFAAENIACFGMGGGLLQKMNRDTMRFAFKSSAQKRNGEWHDIFKNPKDATKASKKGKLKLIRVEGSHGSAFTTVTENEPGTDILETVFENGELVKDQNFADVRKNATL